ncbi:hypothetical protein HJ067_08380 [Vibrio parahaemolyticus]|nr:hypothetical protein [Vibrio parahaemolyticus]
MEITYKGVSICNPDDESLMFLGYSQGERQEILEAFSVQLALENRKNAYVLESDPLYMEWQYDQTPESEAIWRSKVAEIKARYPLPTES